MVSLSQSWEGPVVGLQVGKASSPGTAAHRSGSPSLSCSVKEKGCDSTGFSHDLLLPEVPTSTCYFRDRHCV